MGCINFETPCILIFELICQLCSFNTNFSYKCLLLSARAVIYLAFWLDVAQGHMNGAPNET